MDLAGEMLPGMNVTVTLILTTKTDVITMPEGGKMPENFTMPEGFDRGDFGGQFPNGFGGQFPGFSGGEEQGSST